MHAGLIVNAASGSGLDAGRIERELRAAGAEVTVFELGQEREAASSGVERLVAAGGDGTVAAVAAAAGAAGKPLAVVAAGTANDFARAHGLPRGLRGACLLAATGRRTRALELGRMDGRPFLNVASAGLAAPAARRAHGLKRALGAAAYGVGALGAAVTGARLPCAVRVDGRPLFEGRAWQVTVAVSGAFGGGAQLRVADPADGLLEAIVLEGGARAALALRAVGLRSGRVTEQAGVRHRQGADVELDVPGGTEFNVDGEVVRHGPARFSAEPDAFRLVVS